MNRKLESAIDIAVRLFPAFLEFVQELRESGASEAGVRKEIRDRTADIRRRRAAVDDLIDARFSSRAEPDAGELDEEEGE